MKTLAVVLLTLVALASARNINIEDIIDIEEYTAFGYLTKIGAKIYEEMLQWEEEAANDPTKIIGGTSARLGQFPYQAGLHIDLPGNRRSLCGGILVNQRRALTAAHCWNDGRNQALRFTVVLGTININSGGHRQTTSTVVVHPSWTASTLRNDIAMIRLSSAVPLSNNLQPVALPTGAEVNENFAGLNAVVSGYGFIRANGPTSPTLNAVTLPVITNAVCVRSLHPVQPSNICTSGANRRSPCHGDSGGPLVITRGTRRFVIGVVSFGHYRGCESSNPGAYARVTSFLTWIRGQL